MKFTCNSKTLRQSITMVEKAISSRTSLAILENLYIELKDNTLILRGNDLEMGIEHSCPVSTSDGTGAVLVKAKTFSHIMSKISEPEVSIEVNSQFQMLIHTASVSFDILCVDSKEYPVFPSVASGDAFTIKISQLSNLIKHTIFSVSFDETKPFLNGVLMKNEGESLYFITTDGFRLSFKKSSGQWGEGAFSSIVPFKAMNELNKIISGFSDDSDIKVNISGEQVAFSFNEFVLVSRLIKGQFPDFKKVMPKQSENVLSVTRTQFLDACERASIIAEATNNVIHITIDDKMTLKASAPNMGEFKESLVCNRSQGQDEVRIAFNVKLLVEAIKILNCDDIQLSFDGGVSPCVIKEVGNEDYTYIVMPIRTSDFQKAPEPKEAASVPA